MNIGDKFKVTTGILVLIKVEPFGKEKMYTLKHIPESYEWKTRQGVTKKEIRPLTKIAGNQITNLEKI